MVFKVPLLRDDSQHNASSNIAKATGALITGLCLVVFSVLASSALKPTLANTNAAESASLFGVATKTGPVVPMALRSLPGPSPWKELALAAIEDSNRCDRDVSMNAHRVKAVMASMSSREKAMVVKAESAAKVQAKDLLKAGQVAPLGFFDPLGLSAKVDEGKLLFYREAEIKHGRVCMLATVGILAGEKFHTFFPNIDVPAAKLLDVNYNEGSLQGLWAAAFLVLGAHEIVFDILGANGAVPKSPSYKPEAGVLPGDIGWDPLNLKPSDPAKLVEIQNKELNNGRLAMFAALGIVAQEMVTGKKIF